MSLYQKKKTLRMCQRANVKRNKQWRKSVVPYFKQVARKLTKADKKRLKAVLGLRAYSGPIRASDLDATCEFGRTCIDVVHARFRTMPGLRAFHITLIADEFNVSERKPKLKLKQLKGKAYKEIQELGLDALVWIDKHPLPNWSLRGKGGTYLFHVHAMAFTSQPFDLKAARRKLKKSRSWSCRLGAKATNIKEITSGMGAVAWWAGYDAKPPQAKRRHVDKKTGKVSLLKTDKGLRPQLAFRLIEGLAQLDLTSMLFSVGHGKQLRKKICKHMLDWQRQRWPGQRPIAPFDVRKLFKRFWKKTKVKRYRGWRIVGPTI